MCKKHDLCSCDSKKDSEPASIKPLGFRLGYDYILAPAMFTGLDPIEFRDAVTRQLENMKQMLINKAIEEYASRAADSIASE